MNLTEAIKSYEEAEEAIGDFFNTDIWLGINVLIENKYAEYGTCDEVNYEVDGEVYSFEVWGTSRHEKDGYVLFTGEDNGEKSHYLFKKENQVEELEW
jgi:hypothetical protein